MKTFLIGGGVMFILVWLVLGFLVLMIRLKIQPPPLDVLGVLGMFAGGLVALATAFWVAQRLVYV